MDYIGYFKYYGPSIKNGLFDAKEAAIALNGFDEVFRYFLVKEDPFFEKIDFNLPVKIQEGSWGIISPEDIANFITVKNAFSGLAYITLATYLAKTASIAAKEGLLKTPAIKDVSAIFRKTYQTIQWVVKYISHVKGFNKIIEHPIFKKEGLIAVKNDDGEELLIPYEILSLVEKCSPALFKHLAIIVSPSQALEIGFSIDGKLETVTISEHNRSLFCPEEKMEDTSLPELRDGEVVTLLGVVTKANETAQTIGFSYKNRVITCKPEAGKELADFKESLISSNQKHFYAPKIRMTGVVDRKKACNDKDQIHITFSSLEAEDDISDDDQNPSLFSGYK